MRTYRPNGFKPGSQEHLYGRVALKKTAAPDEGYRQSVVLRFIVGTDIRLPKARLRRQLYPAKFLATL